MTNTFHDPNDYWRNTDYDEDSMMENGCMALACYGIALLLFLMVCLFLSGCSPRVIENTIVRTDTCFVEKLRRDSIYMHDSIYVHEYMKGDTVFRDRDRWHTLWREKIIRDTAYICRTDTIASTKTEQAKKPLSGWHWLQIWAGRLLFIALALTAVVWGARRWLRKKMP